MPIINIAIAGWADPDLSARIAASVTELTRVHLRKDPTVTAVAISYIDPQHWFAGGKSIASQQTNSFWLDIKVVDGTNTKQELASYIGAIFAGFEGLLGKVHTESYVLVHEVSAAAYGYGGETQEFRFISGKLQAAA
ncbi:tautomerase family protein [Sinorhizobium saheli]|uniref:4-oxalocrotonate tautomerase n=1 Tax=Sinorhizobium saheli TaxID=36856 RepID=A0A178YEE8_SINSA|nr:4-oxalocrotonate tautomerase family protein [Sinorhizobium saheli]MQW85960.1 4-oxalocrotonate tautomerase [Sinorhizobium saheli]OAP45888.1 4-oxalocrotonate tautomerase [Sinorhizobium saheli]